MPRSRLATVLARRFERRLVTVVADAGFGKTALLSSAVLDNALAASATKRDVWLSCEQADKNAPHLLSGLAGALEIAEEQEGEVTVEQIVSAVDDHAPTRICLVLDDVHELPYDSDGAEVLRRLLVDLPANGHVVLGSRTAVPVPTARLAAAGELLRVREQDLLLTGEEQSQFAEARGVSADLLAGTGGWPALAELTAVAGSDLVLDYLWEEVLSRIGGERAEALARLATIGGADQETLAAVEGRDVVLDDIVAGLPLMTRSGDGWVAPHPLWEPALRPLLAKDDAQAARLRAATVHHRRGNFARAVELLAEAEAWPQLLDVIREALRLWRMPVPPSELARWRRFLPEEFQAEPELRLIAGLEHQAARPLDAVAPLEEAAAVFRERGDDDGEMAAIAQLGLVRWWSDDIPALIQLNARVDELAEAGSKRAQALSRIGAAGIGLLTSDAHATLSALDGDPELPGDWVSLAHWMRGVAHVVLGDLPTAQAQFEAALARGPGLFAPAAEANLTRVAWLEGRVEEVGERLPEIYERCRRTASRQEMLYTGLNLAYAHAWLGNVEESDRWMAAVEPLLSRSTGLVPREHLALVGAARGVAVGRDDEAAEALTKLGSTGPAGGWRDRLSLLYVLDPASRAAWDAEPLGPAYRPALRLAQALLAAREGPIDVVAQLDWPDTGLVRAHLAPRWAAELAVAAVAVGNPAPDGLLAPMGSSARSTLVELSGSGLGPPVADPGRAKAAKTLLAALPAEPDYTLRIGALGPLQVFRDVVPVAHPDLRRERVRTLLCYLVAYRRSRREEIAAALWPELDDGGRNLRVTLNYLQRVLQPERSAGEQPWFVRQEGPWLLLTGGGHLEVDAWLLEEHLDRAESADSAGTPSVALADYRAALGLWRGEFLADVPYEEWAERSRARLRTRFVAAANRVGELSLARADAPGAREAAAAALLAEPWDESAHRLAVRAHLLHGDRAAARRALEACHVALAELGVEPEPATRALARELRD